MKSLWFLFLWLFLWQPYLLADTTVVVGQGVTSVCGECGDNIILGSLDDATSNTSNILWTSIKREATASSSCVCRIHFRTVGDVSPAADYAIGAAIFADGGDNAPTGTALGSVVTTVNIGSAGTYSVDLSSPVTLASGTSYHIAICLEDKALEQLLMEYYSSGSSYYLNVIDGGSDESTIPSGDDFDLNYSERYIAFAASY
jgi:hypothetical protein